MIEIVAHCATWGQEFREIAVLLRRAFGDEALRIDHIGSTSIRDLCAKNVIDVQITVGSLAGTGSNALLNLGFVQHPDVKGDHVPPGCAGREEDWVKLFFTQPSGQRRANIHVRQAGKPNQRYALLFRDYLVTHSQAAEAYGELKRRLAASLTNDDAYPDVKDPAVDLIYLAAEEWASRSGWQSPPSDS